MFARELAPSVALLHVFPNQRRVHSIDFASRPVIRPGRSAPEMLRRCRDAISNPPARNFKRKRHLRFDDSRADFLELAATKFMPRAVLAR